MLLRFVIADRDERSGQPAGLMTAAYRLLRAGDLGAIDEAALREHLHWIESQVPVPTRFARKRNVSHKHTHGISWLKAEATEAASHLFAIAKIMRQAGQPVEILRTERPGYVVHEDAWQVVAEPFHGDQTWSRTP